MIDYYPKVICSSLGTNSPSSCTKWKVLVCLYPGALKSKSISNEYFQMQHIYTIYSFVRKLFTFLNIFHPGTSLPKLHSWSNSQQAGFHFQSISLPSFFFYINLEQFSYSAYLHFLSFFCQLLYWQNDIFVRIS